METLITLATIAAALSVILFGAVLYLVVMVGAVYFFLGIPYLLIRDELQRRRN